MADRPLSPEWIQAFAARNGYGAVIDDSENRALLALDQLHPGARPVLKLACIAEDPAGRRKLQIAILYESAVQKTILEVSVWT